MNMRPSRIPLALQCPGSLQFSGNDNTTSTAAQLGSAVHRFCAGLVSGTEDRIEWWESRHPEVAKDFRIRAIQARRIWKEIAGYFPDAKAEVLMRRNLGKKTGVRVSGTADIVSDSDNLIIGDWKTGWKDRDYHGQLLTYLWMARGRKPRDAYRAITIWVMTGEIVVEEYDDQQVVGWGQRLVELAQHKHEFAPGQHCSMCSGMMDCEAFAEYVSWPGLVQGILPVEPNELAMVYDRIQLLQTRIAQVEEGIRAYVKQLGELPLSGGRVLRFEEQHRDTIHATDDAIELLRSRLKEHYPKALGISKSGIYEASKYAAASGKRIIEALREAGNITPRTIQKLTVVNDPNVVPLERPSLIRTLQLEGEEVIPIGQDF